MQPVGFRVIFVILIALFPLVFGWLVIYKEKISAPLRFLVVTAMLLELLLVFWSIVDNLAPLLKLGLI